MASDLGAGSDRYPGVNHGALTDVCADVDIGGHQNCVLGDVGALSDDGMRNNADFGFLELVRGVAVELQRDLVVERGARNREIVVGHGSEIKENSLLDPLVGNPGAVFLLCNADLPGIKLIDDFLNCGLQLA